MASLTNMKTIRIRALITFICLLLPESIRAQVEIDGIYYYLYPWDNLAGVTSNPNNYSGSIVIPNSIVYSGNTYSVFSIDSEAFSNCTELTSVDIPNSVTSISNRAFYGCTGLTSITIPNSVTEIYGEAFSNCYQLSSVVIPNSVTEIGDFAFSECSQFTSLVIPNSVTSIGGRAFENTSLTTITINREIPPSIQSYSFDEYVKSNCTLYVPAGCKSEFESSEGWNEFDNIKESAFSADGLVVLATGAYENLSYTIYSDMTMVISGIGGMQEDNFQIEDIINIEKYQGVQKVFIEDGVTSITGNIISDCIGLTSVTIPNSVTEIGSSAFYNCTDLTSLIVGWTVPLTIEDYTFGSVNKSNCTLYVPAGSKTTYESASGWSEFQNIVEYTPTPEVLEKGPCGDNVTFTLYSDMTMVISGTGTMDNYPSLPTEYYREIKNVIIEDGVTSICGMAFYKYRGMTSVTIPNSVTSIGSEAFYQCYSLSSVAIPNSVTYIGSNAFEQSSLQSVTIPNSVTYIGESAFYNCHYLASVTISNSVTNIGNCVFAESGLTSVDIPNSVTSIGSNAFLNCSGLLSVTIPNSVTSIGKNAFCRCSGLRSVTIPNSVTSIGESAFMECTSLCSMTIPNSLTSIDCYTFASCSGLNSLTIPSSVTRIGEGAFCYTGLSSIIAESEIPPTLFFNEEYENIYMFEGVDKSTCILYVPIGSKSAYENDWGWNGFQNIVELGEEPNTDISVLDNAIYVEQTDGRIGGTMDIPVKLKNSYPVRGFQFNLELPEGTTINGWELSTSRMPEGATLSDMIATKKIDGNKIQVACSLNYGDATFTGNDGEIATVNVTFSEGMEEGTYPIYLTACDLTTAGGIDEDLSDVTSTLVLEDYIVGDANGDGKIRIGDATTILNYIVGTASDNFNEKAADANGDGKIRIGDATTILNIIVNQ